jgi:D-inositol-3-phosphate glycosyltransferase
LPKIVLISPAFPLRGGIAASSERLAREFQAMGHQVVLYSFSLQYPSFLFPGKTQYAEGPAPQDLDIRTTINSINPFSWLITARKIAREQPDYIVTRYWLPFMAPALSTILIVFGWLSARKTKKIGFVDNLIPHEKRFGDTFLSKCFCATNDGFLAMSDSVGHDLKRFSPQKNISISPHPIYDHYGVRIAKLDALAKLDLDPTHIWFLFFGFIRAYKGLDLLLEAMSDQRLRDRKCSLIIAGECYENWALYQSIIDKNKLQNQIVLHNKYIADDQVTTYFSATDLVVQPYRTATQSGITQIALHFNKPTLVTNVGGLPEMVKHKLTGYVTEINPVSIADAMLYHLDSIQKSNTESPSEPMYDAIEAEKARYAWRILAEEIMNN